MNGLGSYAEMPYLWSVVLKGSALLVLGGLIALKIRRSRPAKVHLVWVAVFLAAVLIPAFSNVAKARATVVMPSLSTMLANVGAGLGPTAVVSKSGSMAVPAVNGKLSQTEIRETAQESSQTGAPLPLQAIVGCVWFLGFAFVSVRYLIGLVRLWAVRKRGSSAVRSGELAREAQDLSARLGIRLAWDLRVATGPEPRTAVTWGILRPVVLLPKEAESWPPQRLRSVTVHELAHVRRRDFASQALAELACALYWFNPIVWLGARAMRAAAESAADDAVLESGVRPSDYASDLLEIAKRLGKRRVLAGAGVFVMTNDRLENRLKYVLSPTVRRHGVTAFQVLVAMALCALAATGLVSLRLAGHRTYQVQEPVPGPFSGRVLLPDGKPAGGVHVTLIRGANTVGQVVEELTTDPSGSFSVGAGLKPALGEYEPMLTFEKGGYGLTIQGLAGWKNGGAVKMSAATEFRTAFIDVDGRPAPGINVRAQMLIRRDPSRVTYLGLPATMSSRYAAKTAADGTFVLRGLPQGADFRLTHDAPDRARLVQNIPLGTGPVSKCPDIRLELSGSLSGKVVNGLTGEPAVGVKVFAQDAYDGDGAKPRTGYGEAITDKDGAFTIRQLTPGKYNLNAFLTGQMDRDWTSVAYDRAPLKAGENKTGLDIKLIKGGLIFGTVKYSDGKPLYGTYVGVYGPARPRSGAWVQNCLTDKEGRYVLRVPAGANYVYLQGGPGYAPDPGDDRGQDVTVEDGKETKVDFAVPK